MEQVKCVLLTTGLQIYKQINELENGFSEHVVNLELVITSLDK